MNIDKLDSIVDKYNTTYHRTIKMRSFDIKTSAYTDFDFENNDKDPKSNFSDDVRISKYKMIFAKATLKISQKNFL